MEDKILEIRNLSKTYPGDIRALKNISLSINRGESVAILGLSGAGKSTFLRCINRLVTPDSGQIIFKPKPDSEPIDICRLSYAELQKPRSHIGMIFQHFNLVDRMTVLKNVLAGGLNRYGIIPSLLHIFKKEHINFAKECINRVGLSDRMYVRASELSGGQKQRVGIARALMQKPVLMLADEPVASLDPATSIVILDVLKRVTEEDKITTLINLHSIEHARMFAQRAVAFRDGELVFDGLMDELDENILRKIYEIK